MDQLLQRLRSSTTLRRVQAIRLGARNGTRSARALHRSKIGLRSALDRVLNRYVEVEWAEVFRLSPFFRQRTCLQVRARTRTAVLAKHAGIGDPLACRKLACFCS